MYIEGEAVSGGDSFHHPLCCSQVLAILCNIPSYLRHLVSNSKHGVLLTDARKWMGDSRAGHLFLHPYLLLNRFQNAFTFGSSQIVMSAKLGALLE